MRKSKPGSSIGVGGVPLTGGKVCLPRAARSLLFGFGMIARGQVADSAETNGIGRANASLEEFSRKFTLWTGSSLAFAVAVGVIVAWAAAGPFFGFSETWQLVINTSTTIVTFLMVFLIQRSQNKESLAAQVKLNELLASQQGASNRLINVEDLSEEDVHKLHKRYTELVEGLDGNGDECGPHSIVEAREL